MVYLAYELQSYLMSPFRLAASGTTAAINAFPAHR